MAEFAKADLAEIRRRWPSHRPQVATPTGTPRQYVEGYPKQLGYTLPRVQDEIGGESQPWETRTEVGDWIQPGRAGWSESSSSAKLPETHDCGTPWAWTVETATSPAWLAPAPDPETGARKLSAWRADGSTAYVVPARPYCPECAPGRRPKLVSNDRDPRFGRRHVGSLLEVSGSGTAGVGESPAPGRIAVMDALWESQRLVVKAADRLRQARGVSWVGISRDTLLKATLAGVPVWDVLMVKAWDALPVELDVATPDSVDAAAVYIRRALQLVRQAEGDVERTRKLKAPCILCNRMSLRVHIDNPDRERWYVQCHGKDCREEPGLCAECDAGRFHPQRWPWQAWDALGQALGIDVWAALEGAA